jgi:hypothetical protein
MIVNFIVIQMTGARCGLSLALLSSSPVKLGSLALISIPLISRVARRLIEILTLHLNVKSLLSGLSSRSVTD